ncbi:glycosyltransferase [Candidatus Poribacteria bacterium]|nr:glycosyltransferase [Candidatus Poribacteria bacterium]
MTRIGIDATSLSLNGKGVSIYQYNLIKHLANQDKDTEYFIFLNARNKIPNLPNSSNFRYIKIKAVTTLFMEQLHIPWQIEHYNIDLLHTNTDRLPLISNLISVIYLFEIPDYRINKARKKYGLYKRITDKVTHKVFPISLNKAGFIITCSKNTKMDLTTKYGTNPRKIETIHMAPSEAFKPNISLKERQGVLQKYNSPYGYILHLASDDLRDNTATVFRAYSRAIKLAQIKQKLIVVGNVENIKQKLLNLADSFGISNRVIFTGYISQHTNQQELVSLYSNADAYVDATLYEGFGLQVIESMACGTPVIVSNTTSLPEVVGDSGILVNPIDYKGFANALIDVLKNSQKHKELSEKAMERAKYFTWQENVKKTIKIWKKVLASSQERLC